MFGILPIASIELSEVGYSALIEYTQPSSAVSEEATDLFHIAQSVMRKGQNSQFLFGNKTTLLSDLFTTVSGLHIDEDQIPVSPKALQNSAKFIDALPANLPNPDLSIDPDGEISMTWHLSKSRIFSVSISDSDRIAYAWLDQSNSGRGVENFRDLKLPNVLASILKAFIYNDKPAFRVA